MGDLSGAVKNAALVGFNITFNAQVALADAQARGGKSSVGSDGFRTRPKSPPLPANETDSGRATALRWVALVDGGDLYQPLFTDFAGYSADLLSAADTATSAEESARS